MRTPSISRTEFERLYCKLSQINIAGMHQLGRYAKRCDCDYEHCQGWQMARVADFDEYSQWGDKAPAFLRPGKCETRCDDLCEAGPVHCYWLHEPDHKAGWHSQQDCPVFGPAE